MITSEAIRNFIGFRMARNYWAHGGRSLVKLSKDRNKLGLMPHEREKLAALHGREKKAFLKVLKQLYV